MLSHSRTWSGCSPSSIGSVAVETYFGRRRSREWQAARALLHQIEGIRLEWVFGVALSARGQVLASGGGDATARLWDIQGGTCLHVLSSPRRYERLDITGLTG